MDDDSGILGSLAVQFALLSLFAIGGANAAVPEIHRLAVDVQRWMTDRQFADLFAMAQLAPGPNVIIVTLVGFQAAGIAGALVATVAMCGPTCLLAYFVGRVWERFREARWRKAIQAGLVPVSIGLVGASASVLMQTALEGIPALALAGVTAGIAYFTRFNPLWLLAAAGLAGLSGLI